MELSIRLERDDSIPAFGAFLRCEEPGDHNHVILCNVQSSMLPEALDESGNPVEVDRESRIRSLISTLMHEFGHLLEYHFNLPVNEEAIENACIEWEEAYDQSKSSTSTSDSLQA